VNGLLRFVHLLAIGLWVGEIVFFSFVGAPAIFQVLERARAGDVAGAIFPRYYALGLGAGVVAVVTALALASRATAPGVWRAGAVALALGVGMTAVAGFALTPRARALRPMLHTAAPADPVHAEFARLHRAAVALNAGTLVVALVGLGCAAAALRQ
jgi:hypothetical protein